MEQTEKTSRWYYKYDETSRRKYRNEQGELVDTDASDVRYVLGEIFDPQQPKVLICMGINPSTAMPGVLDPTLRRVQSYAAANGYGAWYMLNLYPQRATDPDDMHATLDPTIHSRNIEAIRDLLKIVPKADVWCAWGGTISKRRYLADLLHGNPEKGIEGILPLFAGDYRFIAYAETKDGHPGHPLVMEKDAELKPLDKLDNLKHLIIK